MTYIDTAVLDLVERMCQRFQMWTGRTNVWLAFQLTNLSIVVYFGWVAVLYWLSGMFALRVFVACFCGAVFLMLTRTTLRQSLETSESQAYRRVQKGMRNPRRVRDAQLRIAFLTLSILLSAPLWAAYLASGMRFMLTTEALAVLTTIVLYVLACDPLPPCEGRVTEWIRSLNPANVANAPAPLEVRVPHTAPRQRSSISRPAEVLRQWTVGDGRWAMGCRRWAALPAATRHGCSDLCALSLDPLTSVRIPCPLSLSSAL
ncbi:MAG: hypothetical protein QM736_09035 [Vicinamibacterales bacterium]